MALLSAGVLLGVERLNFMLLLLCEKSPLFSVADLIWLDSKTIISLS
jgi:hypothetical protein